MWVRFTDDYSYRKQTFTIAYKAGMALNVTSDCAEMAIAAGKAVGLKAPRKGEEPVEEPAGWQSEAGQEASTGASPSSEEATSSTSSESSL